MAISQKDVNRYYHNYPLLIEVTYAPNSGMEISAKLGNIPEVDGALRHF